MSDLEMLTFFCRRTWSTTLKCLLSRKLQMWLLHAWLHEGKFLFLPFEIPLEKCISAVVARFITNISRIWINATLLSQSIFRKKNDCSRIRRAVANLYCVFGTLTRQNPFLILSKAKWKQKLVKQSRSTVLKFFLAASDRLKLLSKCAFCC